MSKKKRPQMVPAPPAPPAKLPVLHGMCFSTFIEEATSISNEVTARRAFDTDVGEYLKQKGLLEEWAKWREAKHAPTKQG